MSRFDLYATMGGKGYVLDLQSDFLSEYTTRVVAPVVDAQSYSEPAKMLNPTIEIDGVRHVVQMQFLSAVPRAALKQPVGNYAVQADEFTRALDLLFQGY